MKTFRLTALLAFLGLSASCSTTYDAYGAPRQTVDPAVAIAGVAAAGLVGYALSNNRSNHSYSGGYTSYRGGYYGGYPSYYGGGYSSCY